MITVLHVSTNDVSGGAAIAAYRLHQGLSSERINSSIYTAKKISLDRSVYKYQPKLSLAGKIRRALRGMQLKFEYHRSYRATKAQTEMFSDDRTKHGQDVVLQMPGHDILNLHWIAHFLDYGSLFTFNRKISPVVWTIHDMNLLTGGCHYSFDCTRYLNGCGACPQLGSNDINDLSRQIWIRKKRIFHQLKRNAVNIVAPSKWLSQRAAKSPLVGHFDTSTIPYGLNTEEFSPRDKIQARKILGIPVDANVILFVAESINNKRKGIDLLINALRDEEPIGNLFVITLGKSKMPLDLNLPTLHIGYLENNRMLSMVYSSADLFVNPSIQDNFPNTILESMSCGTPVIGFDSSGISEMITPSKTGVLVPIGDTNKLHEAIRNLLANELVRREMSIECRETVLKKYASEVQARNYISLYESILKYRDTRSGN